MVFTLKLNKPFSSDSPVDDYDVKQVKRALNYLGYYTPPENIGLVVSYSSYILEFLAFSYVLYRWRSVKLTQVCMFAGIVFLILLKTIMLIKGMLMVWRILWCRRQILSRVSKARNSVIYTSQVNWLCLVQVFHRLLFLDRWSQKNYWKTYKLAKEAYPVTSRYWMIINLSLK